MRLCYNEPSRKRTRRHRRVFAQNTFDGVWFVLLDGILLVIFDSPSEDEGDDAMATKRLILFLIVPDHFVKYSRCYGEVL